MKSFFIPFAVVVAVLFCSSQPFAQESFTITPEGRVGVGTSTPTTDFEVAGEIKAQRITLEEPIVTVVAGSVLIWLTATPPEGYLECDGAAVSRTEYASLFEVIGTSFGEGDGSTTFNLPDFRGQFLRGWDHGAGVDPDAGGRTNRGDGTTGDNVGTRQASQYKSHKHTGSSSSAGAHSHSYQTTRNGSLGSEQPDSWPNRGTNYGNTSTAGNHSHNISIGNSGGSETRPTNISVLYIIKY
jgi:microcystin-dependent protein